MKNGILFIAVILLSTFASAHTPIIPSFEKVSWERLGSKKVNFRVEKDVIRVGLKDGRFTKLKVQVTGGHLNMRKMVVEYANGQKEVVTIKHNFSPRSGSRVIDLDGGKRVIKDITFWYDSKNRPGGKATVHVFGRH
ncbi:MAG: hypothetical protein ACI94Y_000927 [Maribacter sp.]|jgi:hypothetical protein